MASQVRVNSLLGTSCDERIALDAGFSIGPVKTAGISPPMRSAASVFFYAFSTSALLILATLAGCTNLRYGQVDCAILQGEAARMCQEYRQRRADADLRAELAKVLQGFNNCVERYRTKPPDETEKNCSIYQKTAGSVGPLPKLE
jgi:hypothetical protein